MSCEVITLPLAEAEAELVSVNAAISNLYTSINAGGGFTKITVGSSDFSRTYEMPNPTALLKFLQERATYLRNYIASFAETSCSVPKFTSFVNVPMFFRKNQ